MRRNGDDRPRAALALAAKLAPLLAGHPPMVQGMALADLLATWLAGSFVLGDEAATAALREDLLAGHIELARQLVEINFRAKVEPQLSKLTRTAPSPPTSPLARKR